MSQLRFYKIAIVALLALNIIILAFFLLTKPGPWHPPMGFQTEVIDILKLNEEQVVTFGNLAAEHNQKLTSINEQQQALLPVYFESLNDLSKGIDKDSLLNQFQELERAKIEVTYEHFQEIKSILKDDQLPHFEELIGKLVGKLLLNDKKNPPPPKEN